MTTIFMEHINGVRAWKEVCFSVVWKRWHYFGDGHIGDGEIWEGLVGWLFVVVCTHWECDCLRGQHWSPKDVLINIIIIIIVRRVFGKVLWFQERHSYTC